MNFFLLQVERVANMLNYFLLQLVGPQRKSLSLKDPEKYEFQPKKLLKQVSITHASIFLLEHDGFMINKWRTCFVADSFFLFFCYIRVLYHHVSGYRWILLWHHTWEVAEFGKKLLSVVDQYSNGLNERKKELASLFLFLFLLLLGLLHRRHISKTHDDIFEVQDDGLERKISNVCVLDILFYCE